MQTPDPKVRATTGRVAVIGAGYAGLAAAVTLAGAGRKVTVFESAQTLGGRARRLDAHGVTVDNGQHILLGAYSQTLALLRKVHGPGAESELLQRRRLRLEQRGRFCLSTPPLRAPWHLLVGLLTARGLSWRDRRSALDLIRRMDHDKFRCSAELTVGELLAGQSSAAMKHLWVPLCISALNTRINEASAQIFLNVLSTAFASHARDSDTLLPRVDLSTLFPDAAAAYVNDRGGEIRRGTTVSALSCADDGVALAVSYQQEMFASVIVAVGPHQLEHLLRGATESPTVVDALAQVALFAYEPIITTYLHYERNFELAPAMQQLDGEPGQWVFDHGQLRGKRGLAAVVISTGMDGGAVDHKALADSIDAQLRRLIPALPAPSWLQVIAERRATYACVAGLSRPTPGKIGPKLYLAGDYTSPDLPATLEAATRSGVAAARALIAAD